MSSPDQWEMKQLKGGQALHLVEEFNKPKDQEADVQSDDDLNEEYTELELNEDEAPFLKG